MLYLFCMYKPERKGDWMQTYTGKQFWPLDPMPEDIDIRDIAHSLALSCRFNGHCYVFYSVAQHSVLVSKLVKSTKALAALLHDSTEAYFGDIIKPIKMHLPDIKKIEKNLEKAVFQHFGIKKYNKGEIIHADKIALYTEMRDIMGEPPEIWKGYRYHMHLLPKKKIIPIGPNESEKLFLKRYEELI